MPRACDIDEDGEWTRLARQSQALFGQLLTAKRGPGPGTLPPEGALAGALEGSVEGTELTESALRDCLSAAFGTATDSKPINKIIRSIRKQSPHRCTFLVSIVIVIAKIDANHSPVLVYLPIIRVVPDPTTLRPKYVDYNSRVYRDWAHFLATNKLPKATICYPKNGVYIGERTPIEFASTPPSRFAYKVDKWVYFGSLTASGAAGLVGFGALLLPVAAPVAGAALGVGLVAGSLVAWRSARRLWDRAQHGQHLMPNSSAARRSWLDLVCFTLDAANASTLVKGALRARQGLLVVQHSTQAVKTVKLVNLVGSAAVKCKGLHEMNLAGGCTDQPTALVEAIGRVQGNTQEHSTTPTPTPVLLKQITTRRE